MQPITFLLYFFLDHLFTSLFTHFLSKKSTPNPAHPRPYISVQYFMLYSFLSLRCPLDHPLSLSLMATNTWNSVCHKTPLRRRHSIDCPPSTAASYSFFRKPTTTSTSTATASTASLSHTTFAISSTTPTATPSANQTVSFDALQQHLSSKNFREADEETRRLLLVLAGEAAQKRGYVFFSEVQFIQKSDLKAIDQLWKQYSDNKFGYSVQKKIWEKMNRDFTKFFIKLGWMKKLESSEVEQYNYRSFPTEFIWEMDENTPEGHLPLTNALRGTQLLNSILTHPAFNGNEEEKGEEDEKEKGVSEGKGKENEGLKGLRNRVLKTDYSF
ncbi:tetrapyrrole-binding protein, chloroplastic isoform X3 [Olea europaea var. sylvestris]|uniref:tetrapyrrole-binding protein, chloroplastic isoform X2 n=1 Tax=Olea europaea var. sylvestris TaxID=158386 RepID=UPI000C1D8C6B|nr:tetrapyrrole-binding protein, chloroplastic isoform X2 [Olea europaea var. sylvestris]XP_022878895.1 tetrapyrrole-binding protein, chloroplastic isoform X3 [Olea europaea var. sylvestris]